MPLQTKDSFKYFEFSNFPQDRVEQKIFSRHGGFSQEPWSSLNLGGGIGDETATVLKNKKQICEFITRPVESIFDVWQVHSADIVCADSPRNIDEPYIKADGILTNNTAITLLMRFADCVPILLYDPVQHVAGIVHAGWQGTVKQVAFHAVREMEKQFHCIPNNIIAGIGPSIGPDHYEIGDDVITRVESSFGDYAKNILIKYSHSTYLDLWQANQKVLECAGVKNIEIAEICTACNTQDWYSHRAEKGKTGRFGAVIYLK